MRIQEMKRAEIIMTKHSVCTTMRRHNWFFSLASFQRSCIFIWESFLFSCIRLSFSIHSSFRFDYFSFPSCLFFFFRCEYNILLQKWNETHVCHLQILSQREHCIQTIAENTIFFEFTIIFIQYFSFSLGPSAAIHFTTHNLLFSFARQFHFII